MDLCCTNEKRMSRCEGMDRVSKEDEEARVKENLEVIRSYLSVQFKGLSLTKDKSEGSLVHHDRHEVRNTIYPEGNMTQAFRQR